MAFIDKRGKRIECKISYIPVSGTRSGINGFLLKKEQSQQMTLAEYFGMGAFG